MMCMADEVVRSTPVFVHAHDSVITYNGANFEKPSVLYNTIISPILT